MYRNDHMEANIANLEKFFTKKGTEFTEIHKHDNKASGEDEEKKKIQGQND